MVGQLSDAGRNSIRLAVEKRFIAKSKLKYKQQFSYDKLIHLFHNNQQKKLNLNWRIEINWHCFFVLRRHHFHTSKTVRKKKREREKRKKRISN